MRIEHIYPSPEDQWIHLEEMKDLCAALRIMFERKAGCDKAFDIWVQRHVFSAPVRKLAMTFHMSRYNIRKRLHAIDELLK